jgi:hypothetical protein
MSEQQTTGAWTELYHPVEHAILSEYLGVAPLIPVAGIDTRQSPRNFEMYICVEPDYSGNYGNKSIASAVARICLEPVQGDLPQWGQVRADGQVNLGRTYRLEANPSCPPDAAPSVHDQLGGLRTRVLMARGVLRHLSARL